MNNTQSKVLLVDDEPNNLKLLQQILKNDYQLAFASNGEQAIVAAKSLQPKLILLDIMMPGMSGYEVCEKLKADETTSHIPVIFVTAMHDTGDEAKGFDVGAVDYIHKPISAEIVKRRVKTHISLVKIDQLEDLVKHAVMMLGEAGHYNDTDTGSHIWRMAAYAAELSIEYGWSKEQTDLLLLAAPMHDMGKIGVPDEILKAPRKLTDSEWVIMESHTEIGHSILKQSSNPVFKMAADVALSHHEKWNGEGYPLGLSRKDIPECARIVAVADVFDALTVKRPYKEAWSVEESIELILSESGKHFDPNVVAAFEKVLPRLLELKEKWSD